MKVFGIEIRKSKPDEITQSVVTPSVDDGSTLISNGGINGAFYAQTIALEASIKNENDLIRRYREVSTYSDCDSAIDDIVNEAVVLEEESAPVEIVLDDLPVSENIKKKIVFEFERVLELLEFSDKGHDIFRNWYIDGKMYYQILVDEKNPKDGIVELRPIDPQKIRKIKNIIREKTNNGVEIVKRIEEYYLYNDKGITEAAVQGVKLPLDSVIYVPSGLIDQNTGMILSYLHKALKIANQLKMMEDALVIYRISRAPERRIFYIDVGNLPKHKAEQYVSDIMNKYRNKIVYDATTGEVRDDRKHLSMLEDFWMPRREGGKGTEITTLQGGQTLGQIEDIQYFQNKLFQALNVPMSRLKGETGFNVGRASEITRDEIKFSKFVARIRNKFSQVFLDALRIQLILRGVITPDDWELMRGKIRFDYIKDNHFSEMKDAEIIQSRLNLLATIDPFVGKYYSPSYVKKHILRLNDEHIEQIDAENEEYNKMMQDQEIEKMKTQQLAQQEIDSQNGEKQ